MDCKFRAQCPLRGGAKSSEKKLAVYAKRFSKRVSGKHVASSLHGDAILECMG
jgi:hypothetical protein